MEKSIESVGSFIVGMGLFLFILLCPVYLLLNIFGAGALYSDIFYETAIIFLIAVIVVFFATVIIDMHFEKLDRKERIEYKKRARELMKKMDKS